MLGIASCKKDDVVDSTPVSPCGKFTTTVDGVPFNSTTALGILVKNTAFNFQELAIWGSKDETEMSTPETFSVGVHSTVGFFRVAGPSENLYLPISDFINLTASDAVNQTITGTFNFTGIHIITGDTIHVTDGVFKNVKYQVAYE